MLRWRKLAEPSLCDKRRIYRALLMIHRFHRHRIRHKSIGACTDN